MQENPNNMPVEEEEGIDIMALIKQLWEGRKTVIIWTGVFIVLGLVAALTMKHTYAVNTVMVPQLNSSKNSSLSSLASLAGFDLGTMNTGTELSPLIYPQIVNSVPYRIELMNTPLHYSKCDTLISMYDYSMSDYAKPGAVGAFFEALKKYTIGLPGVIMGALKGKKEPVVLPDGENEDGRPKLLVINENEKKVLKVLGENVSLSVDKKEGYVTMSVKGSEPIQTAELAIKAQQLLQDEITRFRVEKSQSELDYIQARYNEIKKESESYQEQLARITDRSQSVTSTRDRIERDRIQTKYTMTSSIYSELAKQLEQAKMQVKKDTPVFTVVQPVTVPTESANSRAKTLIVWTFLGFILGCGIVLGKGYMPKLKEMFASNDNEAEN